LNPNNVGFFNLGVYKMTKINISQRELGILTMFGEPKVTLTFDLRLFGSYKSCSGQKEDPKSL